jgi:hypothetical protein
VRIVEETLNYISEVPIPLQAFCDLAPEYSGSHDENVPSTDSISDITFRTIELVVSPAEHAAEIH